MPENWIKRGKEIIDIEIEGLAAVRETLGHTFAQAVELIGQCPGRVAISGIGKSGLVGRKIAATLSSTGTPAYFLHPVEGAHGDLGSIRDQDIVIAISYSGNTDELNAILPALRSLGAKIIAITGGLNSTLAELSDIVLNAAVPREACTMNLAPTSSTTATLAIGDALAVCLSEYKSFTAKDFKRYHPGGALGQRLSLSVTDIMHKEHLPIVVEGTKLSSALLVLDQCKFGALFITNRAGELAGALTDGDIRRAVCRGTLNPEECVETLMTSNPACASTGMSAAELMDMMEHKSITVLPILDNSRQVAGVVHLHDLLGKGRVKFASGKD